MRSNAVLVSGTVVKRVVTADPDDDVLFACALEAKAEYIVSGNKHVLDIKDHHGVRVITAREFSELLPLILTE